MAAVAERAAVRTLGPAVAKFFGNFRHQKGVRRGERFLLEPWQQDDLDIVYEVDGRGRRLWRSVLTGWARGMGKSPILAGAGLLELASRQDMPDVIVGAAARHQAGIIQGFASGFVKSGPLVDYCRVLRNAITYDRNGGSMRTVSADGALQHGLSLSAGLRDELWAWTTEKQVELYWALETASHKRVDSILWDISTAGWNKRTLLGERYDATLATHEVDVLDGGFRVVCRDRDAQSLMIWRGAPEDADVSDPAVWRRAYPASWIPDSELARLAKTTPENVFRRLILNQWTEAESTWLPLGAWDACADRGREVPPAEPVVLGFVGRYKGDAAALVGWTVAEPRHMFTVHVWDLGEGTVVDRGDVDRGAVDEMTRRRVEAFVVDDVGWRDEVAAWRERWGSVVETPLERARRSHAARASARLYSAVVNGAVSHDGDRAVARHLAQAVVREAAEGPFITTDRETDLPVVAALAASLAHERAAQGSGPAAWAVVR